MERDVVAELRQDRSALVAEIEAAGSRVDRSGACRCPHPQHEDRNPSASIHADPEGVWRWKCHACGAGGDIWDLRALLTGRDVRDLMREARGWDADRIRGTRPAAPDWEAQARRCAAALTDEGRDDLAARLGVSARALRRLGIGWDGRAYTFPMRDADGQACGLRTRTPAGEKRAVAGSKSGLFIPAELEEEGPLYIVEGPSDCAAALDCGVDAIGRPSNNGGADLIVTYMRQHPRSQVVIITDNDAKAATATATREAAERLASALLPLVSDVRIIAPPAEYKDLRAWRNAGATQDDLEVAADEARSRGASGELGALLAAEISGERSAIPFPWPALSHATQALLPGAVTLLCGDAGDGKSLLVLEALAFWQDHNIPWACFELEEDRAYHVRRALAQRVGASWLTDLEQVKRRGDEALAFHREHSQWQDDFGRRIYDAPTTPISLPQLLAWIEERASEGARVIVADPVTAATTSARPWDDALTFMQSVKPMLVSAGASLLLVSHPKRGNRSRTAPNLDDLAGGAAWVRFSQCVLWLQRFDEPKEVISKPYGWPATRVDEINRALRVMKCRNGRGAGWRLGFSFDPQTLRFDERGAIVKQAQRAAVDE